MTSQAARRSVNGTRPFTDLATDRAPTARQEQRLRRLLEIVRALASENAELVQELRAARERIVTANERERRGVERDLHDGAQQSLMAIRVKLAVASKQVDNENLAAKLEEITADADAALAQLRALARGIYPAVLVDRGVPDALRSFAATALLPIRVGATDVGRLSSPVEAALYFCAVEAIQNAAKHAGPSATVEVTLTEQPNTVEFQIEDDGRGFDTTAVSDGHGLVNMSDRIGALGGTLDVVSTPGRGTTIMASVPV
jgi:signal transduction histidine kinase